MMSASLCVLYSFICSVMVFLLSKVVYCVCFHMFFGARRR